MAENKTNDIRSIYDLMAFAYEKLCEDKTFNINDMQNNEKFHNLFLRYIENKNYDSFKAFSILKKSLIEFNNYERFSSQDFYSIILEIDLCEIYIFNSSSCYDSDFKTYSGLNTYSNKKVKIYPNLKSTYIDVLNEYYKKDTADKNNSLRSRKYYSKTSLNGKLKNFVIYCPKDFDSYDIYFHQLYEFKNFVTSKDKLKVVLFPVTCLNLNEIFDIQYTKDKKFYIEKMHHLVEEKLVNRYRVFLNNLDNNIDFLVFPEMLMTEYILNNIKDVITKKEIKFTFCGSIWKDRSNICTVLYEGERIFNYTKKIPFEIKYSKEQLQNLISNCKNTKQMEILKSILANHDFNKYEQVVFEELINREHDVHFIDINTFGRIATFICRDIDDDSFINISKLLLNDFIVLPACSSSLDLCNNAEHLAERYHCTTIMCNTCSAVCEIDKDLRHSIENDKVIGFITTPAKNGTKREHHNVLYFVNDTCIDCMNNCPGRMFYINLKKLYMENDYVCVNIEEITG